MWDTQQPRRCLPLRFLYFSRVLSCGEAATIDCFRHQTADAMQDLEAAEDSGLPQRCNGCSSLWWLLVLPALMLVVLFSRVPDPPSPAPHIPARALLPHMTSMRLARLCLGHGLLWLVLCEHDDTGRLQSPWGYSRKY